MNFVVHDIEELANKIKANWAIPRVTVHQRKVHLTTISNEETVTRINPEGTKGSFALTFPPNSTP